MNNITQRDEESSDESEDNYCTDGNSDEEATILTMYKSCDGTVWSKSSYNSLQRCRSVENIACFETVLILQKIFFGERLCKNFLLHIRKYTVPEAKREASNNFELSIDELKAFLGLCIIRGVIQERVEQLYNFQEN